MSKKELKKQKKQEAKKKKNSAEDVKLSRVFYHYWKFARKYKWWYLLMSFLYFFGNIISFTVVPLFYKRIFDILSVTPVDFRVVWMIFGQILLLSGVAMTFFRIADFTMAKYQNINWMEIDNFLFKKTTTHSLDFFHSNFAGALVSKMTKFAGNFVSIMDTLTFSVIWTVVRALSVLVVLYVISGQIFLFVSGWLILYTWLSLWFVKLFLRYDRQLSQTYDRQVGVLSDFLSNILNFKIFPQKNNFSFYNRSVKQSGKKRKKSWMVHNFLWVNNAVFFLFLEVGMMWLVFSGFRNGRHTVGDVVLIQSYFLALFNSLWNISRSLKNLVTFISDAKEMVQILDQEVEVQDVKGAKELKVTKGEIEFQDTTFSYPNQKENVFHKFNLKISAGQTVGLVGTSGAGKTTITKLLLRFSNLNSGKILIDNQDISQVTQDSLRSQIGYVPQEPVLFHRSIYENIAYAKPNATKKEVLSASKKAHVHEFVESLENGYETMVGERGVKLSGGQKQRVALARAFLKNSPILILDEATSALDSVSEEFIQDALFKLMQNKTVIVVAHRLSTIQKLDRILVIEEGIIKEDGTHQELLKKKGLYADLWERQSGNFYNPKI
jgi:ATP-binding cassette subfamily B protein